MSMERDVPESHEAVPCDTGIPPVFEGMGGLAITGHDISGRVDSRSREPGVKESGWRLLIEARNGFVSLANTGDQLRLEYGGEALPSDFIKTTLAVIDNRSPLALEEDEKAAQSVYCSEPLEEGSRVYVLAGNNDFPVPGPHYISESGGLSTVADRADALPNIIYTFNFSFHEIIPGGPNSEPEAIQKFRDNFIHLAAAAAQKLGGAKSITAEYTGGLVLTPGDLANEGYDPIRIKGDPKLLRRGHDVLFTGEKEDSKVVLKPGEGSVPWVSIRRLPVDPSIDSEDALVRSILRSHLYI